MADVILGSKNDGAYFTQDIGSATSRKMNYLTPLTYTAGDVVKEVALWLAAAPAATVSVNVGIYDITAGRSGAPLIYSKQLTATTSDTTAGYISITGLSDALTGLSGGETLALAVSSGDNGSNVWPSRRVDITASTSTTGTTLDSTWTEDSTLANRAPDSYMVLGDAAASPTIANIDTDNAVNQYQQAVVNVTDFTETITSVTLNGVACTVSENDPTDDQITIRVPGSLDTGSYDLVISGASETATLSGVSYTQTHEYTAPYGLVDSNSLFTGIVLTDNSYFRFVSDFSNGTLDKATAESSSLWGNDVEDIYTPDGGFTGDDTAQIELLYDDGTTSAAFTVTVSVSEAGVDVWPYPLDPPSIPVTWDWGNRHPMTQSRVRLFKGGS